jgi:hypothetical protein
MRSDKVKCCVCLLAGVTLLSACGPLDETDDLPSPEIAEQSSMLVSLSQRVGDWTDLCDESYFTAHGLPNPWKDINRLGIDLGDASCQDLQRDWEIYNGFFQPLGVPNSNTYFSLYNRRVGALRTFMWVPSQQDAAGQYYSVDLFLGDGAMNKVFDHTLLSYDGGGPAYAWAERTNAAKNLDRNYMISAHASDHWIVEDTYLGFDPFAHGTKLYYFDYLVYSHDVGQIKMTGSITNPGDPGRAGLISTATKAMKKAGSGFSEAKKGYGEMVDGIRDAGGFATDTMKMPAVGKILTTVADKAAAFKFGGPGLGTVVAATELVTGFLGWVNGSQAGLSSTVI